MRDSMPSIARSPFNGALVVSWVIGPVALGSVAFWPVGAGS